MFAGYGGADAPPALAAAALAAAADPAEDTDSRLAQILERQRARLDLAAPQSALWLAQRAHARSDRDAAAEYARVGMAVLTAQGRPAHRLAAALHALAPAVAVDAAAINAAETRSADLRARIDAGLMRVDAPAR
ncbi:MAG: hypothetical protein OMOMHJEC_02190 [Xanthomonadales bacterium]|nr:hypothetical protein [Xanthomonadales bacterium]